MSWPVVPLAKALDSAHVFVDGDWIESKDQDPDGDVRLIQLADIGDGYYVDKSNRFLTSDAARRLKCTFLEAGDLLIARMPDPLGRACIFPGDSKRAVTVVDVCIIRPDSNKVHTPWLMQCINSSQSRNQIDEYTTGTTRQRISRGNMAKISVALPPLEEQRRIATILDQAETLRTQRRAALAQLDSLAQSLFLDMFGDPKQNEKGWEFQTIGALALQIRGGANLAPDDFLDAGFPVLHKGAIQAGGVLNLDAKKKIFTSAEFAASHRQSVVDSRYVVVTLRDLVPSGPSIGLAVDLSNADSPEYLLAQGAYGLLLNSKLVIPDYFVRVSAMPSFRPVFKQMAVGSTQIHIRIPVYSAIPIPLPPLALQQTFATRIQAIEALKATHRAALAELDALFASLQQRAFSGELTRPASEAAATRATPDLSAMCTLDVKKMLEALIYVAKRTPQHDFYKSLKALYTGDRQHLESHGCLIYGETYEAMEHGPVPKAAYALTKTLEEVASSNLFADDPMSIPLQRTGNQLIPARDADFGLLSATERKSLDWAIKYFAPMNFGDTKTASHDAAYLATAPNAPIAIEAIIRTLPAAVQRRFFD